MPRILIVDDEPKVLRELSDYLRNVNGYEIITATSAKEAIECLEGVDLAIVDMYMETKESGLEVLRAAKKVEPGLKCIVLTAHGGVSNAVEALKAGACDYVEKQTSNVYPVLVQKMKQALTLETEIDGILCRKTYEDLYNVLKRDRENALDILYKRTEEKVIDLKTEDGKEIWKIIIQFHKSEGYAGEIDSICSKLTEYSETKFDKVIYDILFTINASVNADIRAGFWLADKFTNHRKKKCRKTLEEDRS